MSTFGTIGYVSNSKGDKKYPGKAFYCGLSTCRDMHDLDLYLQRQEISKTLQMELFFWPGHPMLK